MSRVAARRYARALFEVARERGKVDAVERELSDVSRTMRENPEWSRVLQHPNVGAEEKKQILEALFGDKLSEETRDFLFLLVDRRRQMLIPEITAEFVEVANDARGIADAKVISARPLSPQELQDLAERFGKRLNKTLRLQAEVDPSLIGGLVVRIGDRLYDGSVAGKLARFQQQLKHTQVR